MPRGFLGDVPPKVADEIGKALFYPPVVELDALDSIALAELPLPLHETPFGAARDGPKCVVVVLEGTEDPGRRPARELLHHGRRTTAVHAAGGRSRG